MRRLSLCGVLVLMLASGAAHGQSPDTGAATGGKSQEGKGAVQVGAGSTGDVTTGTGGGDETANPVVAPENPEFALVPPSDPFGGPAMLEVHAPERLRCELIGDERARQRCEAKAFQSKKEGARE